MAKKKTGTSKVAKTASNDLALPGGLSERFQKSVQRDAQVASAVISTAWPFISLDKGMFRMHKQAFSGPIDVVVLASIRENAYYEKAYVPGEPQAPSCFALNVDEAELAPPTDLQTKESAKCAGCWADAWGSAERGRGKRCRNTIRISVLPVDKMDAESLSAAVGARIRIPTMSMSGFGEYANKLANGLGRPMFSVVTQLELVSDETAQHLLKFNLASPVNDIDLLDVLEARASESLSYIDKSPEPATSGDTQPGIGKRTVRKSQRKKVASKVKEGR